MAKALSNVGIVSLVVVILGVAAVGIYFGYSLSNHTAQSNNVSTSTSVSLANAVTLQSFSVNPGTSNLTGNINVNSHSQLMKMSLYINGTFMGSFNYSNHYGMMSTMMGGYPYAYSMMYAWNPGSMPMMRSNQFIAGKIYMITMMATFEDGSVCNATTYVHP